MQPKKKPKGGKLAPEEKEANRRISRERVRVEHSIAGVKVFRSRGIYRNFKVGLEDALNETACGLHNLLRSAINACNQQQMLANAA